MGEDYKETALLNEKKHLIKEISRQTREIKLYEKR